MPQSRWPFQDPRDLAVFTAKRITDGSSPVLTVYHETNGDWQFLDGDEVTDEDISIVLLEVMIDIDPTLIETATLPRSFVATRETPDAPWQLFYNHSDDGE